MWNQHIVAHLDCDVPHDVVSCEQASLLATSLNTPDVMPQCGLMTSSSVDETSKVLLHNI